MVRNSKRRAFTIVELVIVIAVIAILAAVMIPTFGGVIESANVSADKQILSTVNSQIAIYTGLGNKIETEADLWKALKGDFTGGSDMTAKFDPRSAKNGYHYWYDATEQEPIVKLLTYEEVIGTKSVSMGKMFVRAAATREAVNFAPAAPRSVVPNYYFLDTKCENKNEIANFFDLMANMSDKTKDDYKTAIANLKAIKGDNKTLAEAVVARMAETAIMTDKGAFIDTTTDTIKYIYIPENNTADKTGYYLSHTVIHVNDADVKDLLAIATGAAGSVIELPADIKVAEGSLVGFENIIIKTQADGLEGIKAIFSAGSVASSATILDKNGVSYKLDGADVMQGETKVGTLTYRNPVTGFDISATGNVAIRTGNNYIALDKIKNGITLTGATSNFTGADANLPLYTEVVWSTETAGVTIDPDTGVVTFADDFNGETVTIKATAVAVNEGTVAKEFTMTVVRVTHVTVNFVSGTNNASMMITNGTDDTLAGFRVDYDSAETTGNFGVLSAYNTVKYNGLEFGEEELEKLGVTAPTVTMTTDGTFFNVGENYGLGFTNVSALSGSIGTQGVTIAVSDKAGAAFTAKITVTVNDNTDVPFNSATPVYTNEYVYKVGNGNKIALGEFFAKKAGITNISEYSVYVYDRGPSEGFFYNPITSMTITNPTEESELDFTGRTGYYWIVLATAEDSEEEEKTAISVKIEVVPGKNITADSDVFKYENGKYGQKIYTEDVILHDDVVLTGASNASIILLQNEADLYGNYFEIKAHNFYDTDSTTSDKNSKTPAPGVEVASGYGLITMYGNSAINNLILDGPVYPEIATGSSQNGYYFFGIVSQSTGNEINGSYIKGFCSPVRVQGNGITINDAVLEGGTWSNLFINNSSTITLNNVTTMQNHDGGYKATVASPKSGGGTYGKVGDAVLGMGIYVHDDQSKALTIYMDDKCQQYNWIPSNSSLGGNMNTLKTLVFQPQYSELIHNNGKTDSNKVEYVNATVAYQYIDLAQSFPSLSKYLGAEHTPPSMKVVRPNSNDALYLQKQDTVTVDIKQLDSSFDLDAAVKDKVGYDSMNRITKGLFDVAWAVFKGTSSACVDVWAASVAHDQACEHGNIVCDETTTANCGHNGTCTLCPLEDSDLIPAESVYTIFCKANRSDLISVAE